MKWVLYFMFSFHFTLISSFKKIFFNCASRFLLHKICSLGLNLKWERLKQNYWIGRGKTVFVPVKMRFFFKWAKNPDFSILFGETSNFCRSFGWFSLKLYMFYICFIFFQVIRDVCPLGIRGKPNEKNTEKNAESAMRPSTFLLVKSTILWISIWNKQDFVQEE